LRRIGTYTSHISKWRRQRDRGALVSLDPQVAGRKPQPRNPLQDEVERLQKENARLHQRLHKAETIVRLI
jgi:transposase-like protein